LGLCDTHSKYFYEDTKIQLIQALALDWKPVL
jgi:hypothetical protein